MPPQHCRQQLSATATHRSSSSNLPCVILLHRLTEAAAAVIRLRQRSRHHAHARPAPTHRPSTICGHCQYVAIQRPFFYSQDITGDKLDPEATNPNRGEIRWRRAVAQRKESKETMVMDCNWAKFSELGQIPCTMNTRFFIFYLDIVLMLLFTRRW